MDSTKKEKVSSYKEASIGFCWFGQCVVPSGVHPDQSLPDSISLSSGQWFGMSPSSALHRFRLRIVRP